MYGLFDQDNRERCTSKSWYGKRVDGWGKGGGREFPPDFNNISEFFFSLSLFSLALATHRRFSV